MAIHSINMKRRSKLYVLIVATSVVMGCKSIKTVTVNSNLEVPTELNWSERMALTLMKQHPNAYEIDHKTQPKWDYVHGLVMTSFEKLYQETKKQAYYDYLKGYYDATIQPDGSIPTYKLENYNIDMLASGNALFYIYDTTKEEKYLKALKLLRSQLDKHPRTSENGFWHKKVYPNQMWLDGLYMGSPFYAHYTVKFENGKNLDDVALQFEQIQKHLLDTKTGLLYHGWDESKEMAWANKQTGTSPNFWSRSLGWYAMALVDVLDYMPENHPKHKELVVYLNQLAEALKKQQHASGLWYQVTDQGNRQGNYLEASGTAMFAYSFAKGANKGYLPKEYKKIAEKAFDGLTRDLVKISPEGYVIITEACAVAGLGGKPYRDGSYEYYVNERKQDNDPKATGPFILTALELNK